MNYRLKTGIFLPPPSLLVIFLPSKIGNFWPAPLPPWDDIVYGRPLSVNYLVLSESKFWAARCKGVHPYWFFLLTNSIKAGWLFSKLLSKSFKPCGKNLAAKCKELAWNIHLSFEITSSSFNLEVIETGFTVSSFRNSLWLCTMYFRMSISCRRIRIWRKVKLPLPDFSAKLTCVAKLGCLLKACA